MNTLPSFKNPPVIETVLGLQFEPLGTLRSAHLGAFWSTLEGDWPTVDEQDPLAPTFEAFPDGQGQGMALHLLFGSKPAHRLRIHNVSGDRMIQVQDGRIHLNWLRKDDAAYPRYATLRPEFNKVFKQFVSFLKGANLGQFVPNQWEVTYVNHIPPGDLWTTFEEWSRVFPGTCAPGPVVSLAVPEGLTASRHFEISPARGRLHLDISRGTVRPDNTEGLLAKLTARGPIGDGETWGDGLDLGHECIVRSFAELTSDEAQSHWGLIS